MACWVTLDELRPLLDHIGGDGVHLEMDFHNEHEVEEAMKIVQDFEHSRNLHPADIMDDADREVAEIIRSVEEQFSSDGQQNSTVSLEEAAAQRILILDGAMGTMIQQCQLREEDYRGCRFANHSTDLKGCNDVLSLTAPYIIRDIHHKYLEQGANLIETNTFNAQRISMQDYGLQNHCREINLAACRLACDAVNAYRELDPDTPRFVAGSIGPTNQTFMRAEGKVSHESLTNALHAAYSEQVDALIDGGVDILLIETIFDVEVARIALAAAQETMRQKGRELPVMLSFAVSTADGYNMLGQNIIDFIASLGDTPLFSIGLNCLSDVQSMTPLLLRMATQFPYRISLYPNAGRPDSQGQYHKSPDSLLADIWPLIDGHWLNILGGCCGTTDQHINFFANAVEPMLGLFISPHRPGLPTTVIPEPHADHPHAAPASESPACPDCTPQPPQATSPEERLFQAILHGKSDDAASATQEAIEQHIAPQDLINGQMIRAMSEVGQRFQDGKAFVPQLLMAGRAMKAALELLKPLLSGTASTSLGKVVIGTVKGDLHDIGKNLVASMLEGCGFEVVNIGIDVSADKFIEEVKKNHPDILCMSALLTTTMGYMKEVIDALEAAGIRNQVKVMVGGAPVTQGFADEIGADGYSDNANSAVTVAKQLLGKL